MPELFNLSRVVRVLKAFHAPLELIEVQLAQDFNQLARGGRTVEHIGELLWGRSYPIIWNGLRVDYATTGRRLGEANHYQQPRFLP